jgi:hypothetical protein
MRSAQLLRATEGGESPEKAPAGAMAFPALTGTTRGAAEYSAGTQANETTIFVIVGPLPPATTITKQHHGATITLRAVKPRGAALGACTPCLDVDDDMRQRTTLDRSVVSTSAAQMIGVTQALAWARDSGWERCHVIVTESSVLDRMTGAKPASFKKNNPKTPQLRMEPLYDGLHEEYSRVPTAYQTLQELISADGTLTVANVRFTAIAKEQRSAELAAMYAAADEKTADDVATAQEGPSLS